MVQELKNSNKTTATASFITKNVFFPHLGFGISFTSTKWTKLESLFILNTKNSAIEFTIT